MGKFTPQPLKYSPSAHQGKAHQGKAQQVIKVLNSWALITERGRRRKKIEDTRGKK